MMKQLIFDVLLKSASNIYTLYHRFLNLVPCSRRTVSLARDFG